MTMLVRKGGIWKTITGAQVFANGAWRSLVAIRVFANGAWRLVANFTPPAPSGPGGGGAITVSISPNPFAFTSSVDAVSGFLTATPSGGLTPYTYAWAYASGHVVTIDPANRANPVVSATVAPGGTATSTVSVTVEDSLGVTATATATGTFENIGTP